MLTESMLYNDTTKSASEYKPEGLFQKTFTYKGEELYTEYDNSEGKLVLVKTESHSGLPDSCLTTEDRKMRCEDIDILRQGGSLGEYHQT
jgi:hypothetical protein